METKLLNAVKEKGTDCDEMKQLEQAYMPVVESIADQYQNRGLSREELLKAGLEGLAKAAKKYDVTYDFKFAAYAVWWIRQSILQAIAEKEK